MRASSCASLVGASLVLLLLLSSGCSAVRLGLWATDTGVGSYLPAEVVPIGPVEQRLDVIVSPRAPAPEELAPAPEEPPPPPLPPPPEVPPPGVEVPIVPGPPVEPAPPLSPEPEPPPPDPDALVGPPLGTAPLSLVCDLEERATREQVRERWVEWDIGEKLVYALVATFDTIVAGALIHGLVTEPPEDPFDHTAEIAMAGIFAADAVALWSIVAFAQPTWRERELEREGFWRDAGGICPTGLVIEREGFALPVDPSGRLSERDEAWLVKSLVERGGPITLRLGARAQELAIPASERCRFAEERGLLPPPFCPVPDVEPSPVLRVRLPAP